MDTNQTDKNTHAPANEPAPVKAKSTGFRAAVMLLRIWLVALSIFTFIAMGLIGGWVGKITIIMATPSVVGEVISISNSPNFWDGKTYRYVIVRLPYSQLATMELEKDKPPLSEGDKIPVRAVRDTARYDTISELYELPRIAITTVLLTVLLAFTFWGLRQYREVQRPYDTS